MVYSPTEEAFATAGTQQKNGKSASRGYDDGRKSMYTHPYLFWLPKLVWLPLSPFSFFYPKRRMQR